MHESVQVTDGRPVCRRPAPVHRHHVVHQCPDAAHAQQHAAEVADVYAEHEGVGRLEDEADGEDEPVVDVPRAHDGHTAVDGVVDLQVMTDVDDAVRSHV